MQLKPWMKVLCWLGLGLGTGFFAGYQVGCRMERRGLNLETGDTSATETREDFCEDGRQAEEALKSYRVEDTGDIQIELDLSDPNLRQQLTIDPENLVHLPYPITEDEFNRNPWQFETKTLDYYEGDEVLHDPEYDIVMTSEEADALLGPNALIGFGGDPNNPTEILYICNEINGTLYYVELIHGNFNDTTEYATAPQEEPNEEDQEVYPAYEVDEDEEENW